MSRWPATIAACTNSRDLMVRTSPRTTRAIGGQLTVAMAMTTLVPEGARMATSTMAKMKDGDGLEELGDAHQHVVDEAAIEAGDRAHQRAEGHGRKSSQDGDQQRGARAVHEAGSEVAPERVGAEQEVAERRREGLGDDGERTAGRDDRRGDRQQHDEGKPQRG